MRSRGQKSKYSRGRSSRNGRLAAFAPALRNALRQASHFSVRSMRCKSSRASASLTSAAVAGIFMGTSGLELRTTARAVVAKTATPSSRGCVRIARTYCDTRSGCQRSSSSPKRTQISSPCSEPQRRLSSASAASRAARRCWNCESRCGCSVATRDFRAPQSEVNSAMVRRTELASSGATTCQLTETMRSASAKLSSWSLIVARARCNCSRRLAVPMCAAMSAKITTLAGCRLSPGATAFSSATAAASLHTEAGGATVSRARRHAATTDGGRLSTLSAKTFSPDRMLTQPLCGPEPFRRL
mmetsp:Transcript_58911/g.189458  ORF Transcript_58911/g.189458 Transcript_58911/m.189458 type:complete len:300 (-) Transcript_58911:435-1334(-)